MGSEGALTIRCPLCGHLFDVKDALPADEPGKIRCPNCGYEFAPDRPETDRLA